ncbi:hypothetical protein IC617_03470 [Neiella sp. HB171785]|uniref:Uncharacterized protein n=1 Tax=Neiella litorisoli TaxID=2771431 RepID=A0A8J6QHE6_9GAMM|nr:hypothetical protein [Neiella litorisoli]MBD1388478.1 hypothetical protein [Neiella litorisoli]
MYKQSKTWTVVSSIVVLTLITFVMPEVIALGLLIDFVGLELFVLLLQVQLIAVISSFYRTYIKTTLALIGSWLSKLDPLFIVPDWETIKRYPPLLFHAVPGVVAFYWLLIFTI